MGWGAGGVALRFDKATSLPTPRVHVRTYVRSADPTVVLTAIYNVFQAFVELQSTLFLIA